MQAKQDSNGYIVRLERGEEVITALKQFCTEYSIPGGHVTGIGAVDEIELCIFDWKKKEYRCKTLRGLYELLSLQGNVSYTDEKSIVHLHAVLADTDLKVIGGHVKHARVSVTCEMFVTILTEPLQRILDKKTGLHLLKL